MKIITFRCDKCKYEKTVEVPTNQQIPRYLWTVGKIEVCDECLKQILQIINNLTPKKDDEFIDSDTH